MPARPAPRATRLRRGHAGAAGRTARSPGGATATAPDLCYSCYQGASAVCSACGETRPCQRISSGSPICRSCRARPPRPYFRCGRDRPVQAEWPAGPVCVGCYEHVRRHPAKCAGCGVVRPLIGSNEQGRLVCGPCAGSAGLDYTCRECGREERSTAVGAASAASWANAPGSCSPVPAGTFPRSCIPARGAQLGQQPGHRGELARHEPVGPAARPPGQDR
jgi:hypothetical protein